MEFLSPQMDIFKSNKAVLDFINSHSEMFSQEDIKKIQSFIKERQKIRKEGIREMKEINKKKNEELIKMIKNLNKKDEEGGEERVSILFYINDHQKFNQTCHNMLGTNENKIGKIEKRNLYITFTLTSLFYLSNY